MVKFFGTFCAYTSTGLGQDLFVRCVKEKEKIIFAHCSRSGSFKVFFVKQSEGILEVHFQYDLPPPFVSISSIYPFLISLFFLLISSQVP